MQNNRPFLADVPAPGPSGTSKRSLDRAIGRQNLDRPTETSTGRACRPRRSPVTPDRHPDGAVSSLSRFLTSLAHSGRR